MPGQGARRSLHGLVKVVFELCSLLEREERADFLQGSFREKPLSERANQVIADVEPRDHHPCLLASLVLDVGQNAGQEIPIRPPCVMEDGDA